MVFLSSFIMPPEAECAHLFFLYYFQIRQPPPTFIFIYLSSSPLPSPPPPPPPPPPPNLAQEISTSGKVCLLPVSQVGSSRSRARRGLLNKCVITEGLLGASHKGVKDESKARGKQSQDMVWGSPFPLPQPDRGSSGAYILLQSVLP